MRYILITGATSFIGKYLIDELLNEDCKIYALVRPTSNNMDKLKAYKNLTVINLDISEVSRLPEYMNEIDVCYHLAWNGTRGHARYEDKLQESNYRYSIETYNVVKNLDCKVFIGLGSQAEYGVCNNLIDENTSTMPNTAYGISKLKTGNRLIDLAEIDRVRVIWCRVFSIYGEGDYENTLLMSSIRKMLNNEPIDMTEGTQYWNYLYVKDLAKILVTLANNNSARGVYNLASNDTRLLREYILELKEVLKSKSEINFGAIPYRSEGKVNIMPSIEKLSLLYDVKKFSDFKNNIAAMILEGNL